jgi:small-conductance mechanosensitive channel
MWDQIQTWFSGLPPYAQDLLLAAAAILSGLLIKWILALIGNLYCRRTGEYSLIRSIIHRLGTPVNFFLPLLILNFALPLMNLKGRPFIVLEKLAVILLIASFAAVLIGVIKVVQDFVLNKFDLTKTDNLRERKIRTQLQFLRKFLVALIILLAVCAILLSFEGLRRIGAGLLTGVGIGGIIIGFAAQKSLGNLLAGFQIAFTQPLRIDDVLVVEGEWGRVEEITLTYVVVNIWDKRRLILPINYFIEKPFQNWTRTTSEIIGTVFWHLDYTAPIDEIRKEFMRLLEGHELWDRQVAVIQVTETTERTIQVRALVSATTSGRAFDLRCFIREQIIAFIQKNHPNALPKTRSIVDAEEMNAALVANGTAG